MFDSLGYFGQGSYVAEREELGSAALDAFLFDVTTQVFSFPCPDTLG